MYSKYETGIIAGGFPIIHPGYIDAFMQCKEWCNTLVVALHIDPSMERPNKIKPVFDEDERGSILRAIRYVDRVISYGDESQLVKLLAMLKPDVRFLGDDYRDTNKPITGVELNIPIIYLERNTNWSTTKLVRDIIEGGVP